MNQVREPRVSSFRGAREMVRRTDLVAQLRLAGDAAALEAAESQIEALEAR